jgi:hypothetical protein
MTSIKTKSSKQYTGNSTTTLDKAHNKKMEDFKNIKNKLPNKKLQLTKLEKKVVAYNKISSINLTNDDISKKAELLFEIDKLKKEISGIENEDNVIDYYWKAGNHLINYYKLNNEGNDCSNTHKKKIIMSEEIEDSKKKKGISLLTKLNELKKSEKVKKPSTRKIKIKVSNSHNIMGFFNNKNSKIQKKKTKKDSSDSEDSNSDSNSSDSDSDSESEEYIETESDSDDEPEFKKVIKDKARLNDMYHQLTDGKYSSKYKIHKQTKTCHGMDMVLDKTDGQYICNKCGKTKNIIIDGDKHSHKEQAPEPIGCPYKKLNHLNEHLAQVQAKETTDIKPKVYLDIKAEMKRRKITISQLDYDTLRSILKKQGYSKLFEHIPYILFKITGILPPQMTREMEEEIRKLFKMTLAPYEKYKLKDRTNYFKYPYAIYKFCQLLGYDDYLPTTKSLFTFKNKKKLMQQDKIWEKICIELDWDFYESKL